jgi:hypothetical protein
MNVKRVRRSEDPHERLTRLAGAAARAIEEDPSSNDNMRGLILIQDGTEGGLCGFGFDDDSEMVDLLLAHAEVICKVIGRPFPDCHDHRELT